jgi:polyhydroxybutyrate depolymerase
MTTRCERCLQPVGAALIAAAMLLVPNALVAQDLVAVTGTAHVEEIIVGPGTELDDALAQLPRRITASLSNGETIDVEVNWGLSQFVETSRGSNIVRQAYFPGVRGPYEVTGTFALPEGVSSAEGSMPLTVTTRINVGPREDLLTLEDPIFAQPGEYVSTSMTFGDVERTYHYYVPSAYDGSESMPLMLTFHGAGSYAIGQLAYSGFDAVAEREGFIVVAPDYGINVRGRFDTPAISHFASAIIDELSERYSIDAQRIYASGISMGGGASLSLAHELSNRIAAVAPVATAARSVLEQTFPRPITIVWFYGNRDSGYGPEIYQTLAHLVQRNHASERPDIRTWTSTDEDPTSITRFTYDGGDDDTAVIYYRIEEGGHTWPGKYQYASLIAVGLTSQHVDATDLIWEHLSEHTLPDGAGQVTVE